MNEVKFLSMKSATVLLLFTFYVSVASTGQGSRGRCAADHHPGRWSTVAEDVSPPTPTGKQVIFVCSPDGNKRVHVKDESWWVERNDKSLSGSRQFALKPHAEVGWAPDSGAFYLTESEGFSTGYYTAVYRLVGDHIESLSRLARIVSKDFQLHHTCHYLDRGTDVGNEPNIAALAWKDSDHLLFIAEVPPVGICHDMDYFGGYLVSLDSLDITERYSPAELRKLWGSVLGPRLDGDFDQLSDALKVTRP